WGRRTRCAGLRRGRPWRGRPPARLARRATSRRRGAAGTCAGSGTARTGVAVPSPTQPASLVEPHVIAHASCQLDPPVAVCPRAAWGPRWLPPCRGVVPPPHRRPPRLRADPRRRTRHGGKHLSHAGTVGAPLMSRYRKCCLLRAEPPLTSPATELQTIPASGTASDTVQLTLRSNAPSARRGSAFGTAGLVVVILSRNFISVMVSPRCSIEGATRDGHLPCLGQQGRPVR